jgi:AraC-like DNA-binding protein
VIDGFSLGRVVLPDGLLTGEPVRLASIEQAREFYRHIESFRISRLDRAAFGWSLRAGRLGPLAFLRCHHDGGACIRLPTGPDLFVLTLPTAGGGLTGPLDRLAPLVAGRAAVIATSATMETRVEDGCEAVHVLIPRTALTTRLTVLLGTAPVAPVDFAREIDIAGGAGAALNRLVGHIVDEMFLPGGALAMPLVAANLVDALLHHMLLRLPHNHIARLHALATPAEPRYLRMAEEFLAANVDRHVSNVELACQVGVSVRAIQLAFRRYRNSSPQRFLRDRRLELARRRLIARSGATVSDIASSSGFGHLGRFSAEYRGRFGESPSETWRRNAV